MEVCAPGHAAAVESHWPVQVHPGPLSRLELHLYSRSAQHSTAQDQDLSQPNQAALLPSGHLDLLPNLHLPATLNIKIQG